jgi:hypothetical protein
VSTSSAATTLRCRAINFFDRLTATSQTLSRNATAALLVAATMSGTYLYAAVSGGVEGWRVLYATHAPSGVVAGPAALASGAITIGFVVAVGLVAVLVLRRCTPPTFVTPHRPTALMTTGLALLLLPTTGAVSAWVWSYPTQLWPALSGPVDNINRMTTAPPWSVNGLSVAAIRAVQAGIGEELCALAIPIWAAAVLCGAAKVSPRGRAIGMWVLGGFLVACRIGYHLWQGPLAFTHLPWAIATVWFFLATRRVIPIIIAHIINDIGISIADPIALNGWLGLALSCALPLALGTLVVMFATHRPHAVDSFYS